MKLAKVLTFILAAALIVWAAQALYYVQHNTGMPARITSQAELEREKIEIEQKRKLLDLEHEYEEKKYIATGDSVFERIFNTQDQTITDLIQRVSREALPDGWSSDVRVEEFTHFILLVYVPHNEQEPPFENIVNTLRPILKYCSDYLSDVAVFDRRHKSYLFFDKSMLTRLESEEPLTREMIEEVKSQGTTFTRSNSVTIKCAKYESHLLVPIEVSGPHGVVELNALFDTGASVTMLPSEIVAETGGENLQIAPRKTFDTANGAITCPIVRRDVALEGIRKGIEVAVGQRDTNMLIGMNFFEGMDFIIDFGRSEIHVWEK